MSVGSTLRSQPRRTSLWSPLTPTPPAPSLFSQISNAVSNAVSTVSTAVRDTVSTVTSAVSSAAKSSSVERELYNWLRELNAIDEVLGW